MNLEIENSKNFISSNLSNDLKKHLEKTNATFSIDRFEGNYAVCENMKTGEFVNISKDLLPEGCSEGSILKFENGKYIFDIFQTKQEQDNIKNLVDNLFKKK